MSSQQNTTQKGYLHRRSDSFGKLPEQLMHDLSITDGAKVLYSHMHWRYGSNCDNHEGRASMSRLLGVSERAITKRINELEVHDWVVVKFRSNERGRTSNEYHVFEVQDDCRQWRRDHDLPKPVIKTKGRKTRKHVGGKKTHKSKQGSGTQVPQPSELRFRNLVNSSSANPDSLYSDSKRQTHSMPQAASTTTQPQKSHLVLEGTEHISVQKKSSAKIKEPAPTPVKPRSPIIAPLIPPEPSETVKQRRQIEHDWKQGRITAAQRDAKISEIMRASVA